MALSDRSVSIDDEALAREPKLAIVLGTEETAFPIPPCILRLHSQDPHVPRVDSLNVAAASAVAFWQLGKQ